MHAKKIDRISDAKIIEELKTFPNQGIIWGLVHQDDPNMWELPSGESIMIMEPYIDDPFVFIAGQLNTQDIDAVIKICPADYPRIYCNNMYHHDFLKKGWDFHVRAELSYSVGTNHQVQLEEGWKFKKIDSIELFEQCYWYEKYAKQYASLEAVIKSSIYVLCNNNIVISEGYIDHHSSTPYAEISVATNRLYRGQGAGAKIASFLVEKCNEIDLIAIWTCQVDNSASLNTALKAGFKIDRYYINMVPEVGNILSPKLEKWINENTPIDWNQ